MFNGYFQMKILPLKNKQKQQKAYKMHVHDEGSDSQPIWLVPIICSVLNSLSEGTFHYI